MDAFPDIPNGGPICQTQHKHKDQHVEEEGQEIPFDGAGTRGQFVQHAQFPIELAHPLVQRGGQYALAGDAVVARGFEGRFFDVRTQCSRINVGDVGDLAIEQVLGEVRRP